MVRASAILHALALIWAAASPADWPLMLGAIAANHGVLGAFGMVPRNRLLGPNLTRLPDACAEQGVVGLTFDDGPDPAVTPAVLDLLDRHGATASFFCIGKRARANPRILRDIVRRGHSVENHTDRHPLGFAAFGLGGMRGEVDRAQDTLCALAGRPPGFFRAPAGLRSPLLDPVLSRAGLCYTTWTRRGCDSLDRDPGQVLRHLVGDLRGGDILLLHDGTCGRTRDGQPLVLAVLPDLLAAIEARGLRAVSLPHALTGATAAQRAGAQPARPR